VERGAGGGRQPSFLDRLPEPDRAGLMALGRRETIEPGEPVLAVARSGIDMVVLEQGYVKVISTDHEGRQVILDVGGPGDIYGEAAVVTGWPRMASVVSLDKVVVRRIKAEAFRQFLHEYPETMYAAFVLQSKRLWNAQHERSQTRSPDTVPQIARRLLYLVDVCASEHDGSWSVNAPLTQEEQAEFVPVARRTLAKALKQLRQQGVVVTGRRSLTVTDLGKLQRLAGTPLIHPFGDI